MATRSSAEPPPLGPCRYCGDPVWGQRTWLSDEVGPAHSCCEIHERENPYEPCIACAASAAARGRRRSRD